ncbi:hypothetical protein G6F66_015182 [Rhizopus arrhizus]|nr:hypothetical protein G6F66_015182 [Rhizopus arrhizus]
MLPWPGSPATRAAAWPPVPSNWNCAWTAAACCRWCRWAMTPASRCVRAGRIRRSVVHSFPTSDASMRRASMHAGRCPRWRPTRSELGSAPV